MTSLRSANATLKDRLANMRPLTLHPIPGTIAVFKVKKVNGLLFALTSEGVLVSSDGVNFQQTGDTGSDKLHDIAFGNDIYTTVGNSGQIYTSSGPGSAPDFDWGWVERTAQGDPADDINAIEFTGTHFVIGGDNSLLQRATDGASWASVSPDGSIDRINSIAVGSGITCIVGAAAGVPAVEISTDHAATFAEQSFDGSPPGDMSIGEEKGMNRIIHTGTHFVVGGIVDVDTFNTGIWLQQSTNGAAWTDITSKLVSPALAGQVPEGQQDLPLSLLFSDGHLFLVNEWGDMQLSKWNGSSFANFERIPFLNLPAGISSIGALGGNYLITRIASATVSYLSTPSLGVT